MEITVDTEHEKIIKEVAAECKTPGEVDFETFVYLLTLTFWHTLATPCIKSELMSASTDPFTVKATAYRRKLQGMQDCFTFSGRITLFARHSQ
eukprot:1174887-Pyramimonas_sp.AAC.1